MQPAQKINAIDVKLAGQVDSSGIAYYNPESDGDFYKFLNDVSANEVIIGFEWDSETGRFGVILGKK